MKKRFLAAVLAGVMALSLTACGVIVIAICYAALALIFKLDKERFM